jgi:LPXTG-motif cell wall-anchored protein
MKKLWVLLVVAVIVSLVLPGSASAAGYFYCSTLLQSGGNGTFGSPWACATEDQLNNLIDDVICQQYYGGTLYRIYTDAYVIYWITWVGSEQSCQVTVSQRFPGYPPNTGPEDFPLPLLLGGVAIVAVGLLAGGLALRRKKEA